MNPTKERGKYSAERESKRVMNKSSFKNYYKKILAGLQL